MTTNANLPAMPCVYEDMAANGNRELYCPDTGLTKKELFCLHHGVAETGDPELDAIISKGNHQKAAMASMQAWIIHHGAAGGYGYSSEAAALGSIQDADALLAELERNK